MAYTLTGKTNAYDSRMCYNSDCVLCNNRFGRDASFEPGYKSR